MLIVHTHKLSGSSYCPRFAVKGITVIMIFVMYYYLEVLYSQSSDMKLGENFPMTFAETLCILFSFPSSEALSWDNLLGLSFSYSINLMQLPGISAFNCCPSL